MEKAVIIITGSSTYIAFAEPLLSFEQRTCHAGASKNGCK